MGKWTNEVVLQPIEFDGDNVVFTVKRLLSTDMGIVLRNYDPATGLMRFTSHAELAAVAAEIFPKYITKIEGMKKADGTEFTLQEFAEVSKEFYFVALITGLFTQLMEASSLSATDSKNSAPPAPE